MSTLWSHYEWSAVKGEYHEPFTIRFVMNSGNFSTNDNLLIGRHIHNMMVHYSDYVSGHLGMNGGKQPYSISNDWICKSVIRKFGYDKNDLSCFYLHSIDVDETCGGDGAAHDKYMMSVSVSHLAMIERYHHNHEHVFVKINGRDAEKTENTDPSKKGIIVYDSRERVLFESWIDDITTYPERLSGTEISFSYRGKKDGKIRKKTIQVRNASEFINNWDRLSVSEDYSSSILVRPSRISIL